MANRGQSYYLRIYSGSTTYVRWQSYYVNQTVTWQGASWSYQPFAANGLLSSSASGGNSVAISIPATSLVVSTLNDAINNGYLCEVRVYEFDTRLTQSQPQSTQILIGFFAGEVVSMRGSFTELTVQLGNSLAPVGAQVPPRQYTTFLVGAPLRL
jgi:hypothetical protein